MPDDPCDRTATELALALRSRQVSAREVLDAHLRRIERTNPSINAIVTLVPERAMQEAAAADERLARGDEAGPLHGLPIAIKDLVQTAGIRTTFGSPIFADNVPQTDDLLVQRVRAAGAVVIGKTNAPEWGAGSHTFNEVFGPTRNPYDLGRSAGGSSGGAAAALAAGMIPIADGSDLGGSLRNPASFCNVVGLRPSAGRVPTWPSTDTRDDLSVDGPMGRSVDDVALLLSAIAGPDDRVPISRPDPAPVFTPPVHADVTGTRIAWAPSCGGTMPVEPEVVAVVDAARPVFEALGCTTEEAFPDLHGAREAFFTLRAQMFAATLGPLLERHRDRMKAAVVWNIEMGLGQGADDIARALAHRASIDERIAAFFQRFDAIAMPVSQVPPFPVDLEYPAQVAGEPMHTYLDWMESCWAISVTGLPAISVPCGFTAAGLPVGIQVVGRRWDDLGLLGLAKAFEGANDAGGVLPGLGIVPPDQVAGTPPV